MPPKSRNQQIAAIIAEKVKSGKAPVKKGTPSAQMAKMKKSSLQDFAQANVVPKKGKKTGDKAGMGGLV